MIRCVALCVLILGTGARTVARPPTDRAHHCLLRGDSLQEAGQYLSAHYYLSEAAKLLVRRQQWDRGVYAINQLAINYVSRGELALGRSFARKAVRLAERYLPDAHPERARSYGSLGTALVFDNQPDSGLVYSQRSVLIRKRNVPHHKGDLAESYDAVGSAFRYRYQADSALHYHRKALRLRQHATPVCYAGLVRSYLNLSADYLEIKHARYDSAIYFCQRASGLAQERWPDRHPLEINVYGNLAKAFRMKGYYEEALTAYQKALAIQHQFFGSNHANTARFYQRIGTMYVTTGAYAVARKYYQTGLTCLKTNDADHASLVAQLLANLGVVADRVDRPDVALDYFHRARRLLERRAVPNGIDVADIYEEIGRRHTAAGRYDSAYYYLHRGRRVRARLAGEHHSMMIQPYLSLGELHEHRADYPQALHYYRMALRICRDVLGPVSPSTAAAWTQVGKVHRRMGHAQQALRCFQNSIEANTIAPPWGAGATAGAKSYLDLRELLFAYQAKAATLLESGVSTAPWREALALCATADTIINRLRHTYGLHDDKIGLSKQVKESYQTAIAVSSKLYQTTRQAEYLARSFYFSERSKANTLVDALSDRSARYRNPVISLLELQGKLAPHDMLLTHFMGDSVLYQFTVTADTAWLTHQPIDSTLTRSIQTLRSALTPAALAAQSQDNYYRYTRHAFRLYQRLLQKSLAHPSRFRTPTTRLMIVPDDELAYVPYDVLLSQPARGAPHDFRNLAYLVNDYTISYGYSATWMYHLAAANQPVSTRRMIAFAPGNSTPAQAVRHQDGEPLLRWNAPEVEKISHYFPAQCYTGRQAQERTFKEEAPGYALIHLAMHGYVNSSHPMESKLVFSRSDDTHEDNVLYARELYGMNLSADLVVLSACQTGDGALAEGEGVLSVARGFAYAGCKSIVTSNWAVDDQATVALMDYFYEALANGQTKDEALRQAKRRFLEEAPAGFTHPYYWGNFALWGSSDAVVFRQVDNARYWYPIVVVLALVGGGWIGYRLRLKRASLRI